MASIRLEKLTKQFGDLLAVDDLNLEIGDGQFAALLGPSGCGKTTTMNMIAGLEIPTSGLVICSLVSPERLSCKEVMTDSLINFI